MLLRKFLCHTFLTWPLATLFSLGACPSSLPLFFSVPLLLCPSVPVSQSMIGHCLGAAGGLEAIAVLKAIQTGWLHPSINQFVSARGTALHRSISYLLARQHPASGYAPQVAD